MAETRPPRTLAIVLAIIVVAAGGGGIGFLYYENHRPGPSGPLTVQVGDNATVNYIGIFGAGPQVGRVFDTSEYAVAMNDLAWPKSLLYTSRGASPANYTPLPVYVGSTAPAAGYTVGNLTFSSVVTGFWQGLVGLPGNQTHYVTVPPSLGYSFVNRSCFVTQPLTYTKPVLVTLTPAGFASAFPSVTATPGLEFTDPLYGWPDLILTVNATAVAYENLPSLGMTTSPSGWSVAVTSITSTTITLVNQLSPGQAGLVKGKSTASICGTTSFIVSQVNLGASTYTEDFNTEVAGQTLIFIVSVVDIFPPS